MAEVVLGIGSSHGPSIQSSPEQWAHLADGDTRDPRFDYQDLLKQAKPGLEREIALNVQRERHNAAHRALKRLSAIINDARLDVIVVVSNPHRIRPADNHPVFGVFRGDHFPVTHRSEQPFDPDARFIEDSKRQKTKNVIGKKGESNLANHLLETLIEDGFDVGCTDQLPEGAALDDAFAFPYDWLLDGASPPMVPFLLSRDLPNQAYPRRCYLLGQALSRAIKSWPRESRVGLIASGGLSHQVVDEELDRQVIAALVEGKANELFSLPRERLNRGPGTPEILNWITVAGAMAPLAMKIVDYLPCYRSLAGTGHGLTFGYWQ